QVCEPEAPLGWASGVERKVLPCAHGSHDLAKFFGVGDGNASSTYKNYTPLLPIAEDATYAFAGGANVASDFLMRHVQGDAQTLSRSLAVLVCPSEKELSEFGVRIGGQRQHTRLLPGLADFHAEMLGHTQGNIRMRTHQLKKGQTREEAHLAGTQRFSRDRVGLIRNQRTQTEYFTWLHHPQREALALRGIYVELRLASAHDEESASRLPLNKQQCTFRVKSSLAEIIDLGQGTMGKLTE